MLHPVFVEVDNAEREINGIHRLAPSHLVSRNLMFGILLVGKCIAMEGVVDAVASLDAGDF